MPKIALSILLFLALTNCGQKTTAPQSEKAQLKVSATYKPLAFRDSQRVGKIKNLAPRIDSLFRTAAKERHYPGLVYGIVSGGELILSGTMGTVNIENESPVTTSSLFKIASMTKSFTAMAILKLSEEGKLHLSEAAATYVPELAELEYLTADASPITIENLLTMTAGFPEDNPWGDRQLEDTPEELLALIREGLSLSNNPSAEFEYSNTGYAILGHIISQVSGKPYQQYITENILTPLGMNNTYWEFEGLPADRLALGYRWEAEQWKVEPMLHDGSFGAMGGLITSLDDFSKYVLFHLSAYPFSNKPDEGPVKRGSLRAMHKPNEPALYAEAKDAAGNTCPVISGYGYGLGWRKDCKGVVRVSHSGGLPGFGSEYRFYPEYDLGIISFANRTYAGTGSINQQVAELIFAEAGLEPRVLPASDILLKRQTQVVEWLSSWDAGMEQELFAENFFPDFSKEIRKAAYMEVLEPIGNIRSVSELNPQNQLRGTFVMNGEKGKVRVFFTLSPEKTPKVQQLDIWPAE